MTQHTSFAAIIELPYRVTVKQLRQALTRLIKGVPVDAQITTERTYETAPASGRRPATTRWFTRVTATWSLYL